MQMNIMDLNQKKFNKCNKCNNNKMYQKNHGINFGEEKRQEKIERPLVDIERVLVDIEEDKYFNLYINKKLFFYNFLF